MLDRFFGALTKIVLVTGLMIACLAAVPFAILSEVFRGR